MELHEYITDGTLLTITCKDCISNMEVWKHGLFGKSVTGYVSSVTLGIRVCLLFQKCLYKTEVIYLRKKKYCS